MLINLSNHPSPLWDYNQLVASEKFGTITDIKFPAVDENANKLEITTLAKEYISKIISLGSPKDITIHIMGEQTFCYYFISEIKKLGYTCIASTSKRIVNDKPNGKKEVTFSFCRFREY
jgi:hypothetical protein